MFKVLDHPFGAVSCFLLSYVQLILRLLLSLSFYLFATSHILAVAGQDVVNGQVLTQGFAILDSPQPDSTLNAGSNADIAIQVPSLTNAVTALDLLEVYLVSSVTQTNITVSSGPQLLTQEPGSDVKHIHWSVPTCLQNGPYNLTLYETSHSNGASYFAITPVPVQVNGNGGNSGSCNATMNPLQEQPQLSSPPPPDVIRGLSNTPSASPSSLTTSTVPPNATLATPSATATDSIVTPAPSGGVITVTAGNGDITIGISDLPGTIVVEPSGGAPPETSVTDASSGFITIFKTVAPTATATLTEVISEPVTITLEETYVSTSTAPGATLEFTVTQTVLSTMELVTTQVTSPQQVGLLPVNSGWAVALPPALLLHWTTITSAFLYVFWSIYAL
ncbi:hypothetical protein BD414DRAFT_243812 [Trametes punicea]|nr:hypothetical protein BD414DRAFT_243812 [Trametes punicea]